MNCCRLLALAPGWRARPGHRLQSLSCNLRRRHSHVRGGAGQDLEVPAAGEGQGPLHEPLDLAGVLRRTANPVL